MAYRQFDPRDVLEPITGGRLVKAYDDQFTDCTVALVEVRIEGRDMMFAANNPESLVRRVQGQVDNATRGLRYDRRPRPRLGAGTVGYARRRR